MQDEARVTVIATGFEETRRALQPQSIERRVNERVIRGGSMLFQPWPLRSAYRAKSKPANSSGNVGFRVIVNPAIENN